MEQAVRQLQGDIQLKQQIIRNKIRSADKIQDHFSEQILERTQRVIFNIEIGGKLPAENLRAVFSIPVKCGRMKGFDTVIPEYSESSASAFRGMSKSRCSILSSTRSGTFPFTRANAS